MSLLRFTCLAAALLASWLRAGPAAASAWDLSRAQREAVERGEIVVVAARATGPAQDQSRGRPLTTVQAAVRIAAAPDAVFAVMTDCADAPRWVPRLEACRVLATDTTGTLQTIAHRVDYGWFLPRFEYVFEQRQESRRRITFVHVSGDLDENRGVWALEDAADGRSTIVTYSVRSRPKFHVPARLYERGVTAEIPALLRALRSRAE
jgi:ribosome-associated toxin RatA of RatAB toxin-antitoxin module